jgi:TonB family protein
MKCRSTLLIAAAFIMMICAALNSLASEVKVVANSSLKADSISASELRRVFMEEKISLDDGSRVEPVLEKDGPVHAAFLQQILGISVDDLHNYYRTLLFTGKGSIPKAFSSDAEVVSYVSRTRGAIGYIDIAASAEGVKVLAIANPSHNVERRLISRIEPDYPETLQRLNIGGTVRLRLSISPQGSVDHVELLGGNPILAESAIIAVKKWVYAAGRSRTISEVSLSFGSH